MQCAMDDEGSVLLMTAADANFFIGRRKKRFRDRMRSKASRRSLAEQTGDPVDANDKGS